MILVQPAGSYREAMLRAPRLVALAIQPSGEGPYVDAVHEWIDRVSAEAGASLRLVR